MFKLLQAYPRDCFKFSENFLRMSFPNAWDLGEDEEVQTVKSEIEAQVEVPVTSEVTMQVILSAYVEQPMELRSTSA